MSNGAALILCFYILLRASMGLRFAAFMEGSSPNTRPITVENATAAAATGILITIGIADILAITAARRIPANTPRIPPMLVSTAASVRN